MYINILKAEKYHILQQELKKTAARINIHLSLNKLKGNKLLTKKFNRLLNFSAPYICI